MFEETVPMVILGRGKIFVHIYRVDSNRLRFIFTEWALKA